MLIILCLALAALGGWWYGFRQGKRYGFQMATDPAFLVAHYDTHHEEGRHSAA